MRTTTLEHKDALQLYRKNKLYEFQYSLLTLIAALITYYVMLPYAFQDYRNSTLIAYFSSLLFSLTFSKLYERKSNKKLQLKWERNTFISIYAIVVTSITVSVLTYFLQDLTLSNLFNNTITRTSVSTSVLLGFVGGFETPSNIYLNIADMKHSQRKEYFESIKLLEPSDLQYISNGLKKLNINNNLKKSLDDITTMNNEIIKVNLTYNNPEQLAKDVIEQIGDC